MQKPNKIEEFIINHCRRILYCADLSHFELKSLSKLSDKSQSAMEISTDYKYLCFKLSYNNKEISMLIKNNNHRKVIAIICHEISHIVTGEIEDRLRIDNCPSDIEYYGERLTESVSRWLYGLYVDFYVGRFNIDVLTGKEITNGKKKKS